MSSDSRRITAIARSTCKEGKISDAERLTRKRENDKKYRQRGKLRQEEVKSEKEKLAHANTQLEFENGQLKRKIQEKEQDIEQLKKENQEKKQQWKSNREKCVAGFGQLKHEIHEKEQIVKSMQKKETRLKSMVETMEAEANDKLLKSRSCSCNYGQQCKPDAIENEDLQTKSELAQIRNERTEQSQGARGGLQEDSNRNGGQDKILLRKKES